jgi:3-hydroxyacyl-CoA dehydrogenase
VPLVEIAKGESTSDSTVDKLHAVFASLGRAPVRVNRGRNVDAEVFERSIGRVPAELVSNQGDFFAGFQLDA